MWSRVPTTSRPERCSGYLAIALAVVGVAGGIVAVVTHRGRRAGVVGIVIGVVANPFIVLGVLRLLDGLRS